MTKLYVTKLYEDVEQIQLNLETMEKSLHESEAQRPKRWVVVFEEMHNSDANPSNPWVYTNKDSTPMFFDKIEEAIACADRISNDVISAWVEDVDF